MALPLADVETWLTDKGVPGVGLNWLPDEPDAVVIVQDAGGTPPASNGVLEDTHVIIRTRATTDAAAEAQAIVVHKLITALNGSFTMGGTYVVKSQSFAPPRFMGRDVDERTQYAATYAFTTPTA